MNNNVDKNSKEYKQRWLSVCEWLYYSCTVFETPVPEKEIKKMFDDLQKKNDQISHLLWVQEYTPEKSPVVYCTFLVDDKNQLSRIKLKEMLEKIGPSEVWHCDDEIGEKMFEMRLENPPNHFRFNCLGKF